MFLYSKLQLICFTSSGSIFTSFLFFTGVGIASLTGVACLSTDPSLSSLLVNLIHVFYFIYLFQSFSFDLGVWFRLDMDWYIYYELIDFAYVVSDINSTIQVSAITMMNRITKNRIHKIPMNGVYCIIMKITWNK